MQQDSQTSMDELLEQVRNGADGKLRLKCKLCSEVFAHHKPSLFKAHLETKHPDLGKVHFPSLSSHLRHVCLQQVMPRIGGPTCVSCKAILPAATATSLQQHLRVCQRHHIEVSEAQTHLNIILSYSPAPSGSNQYAPTESSVSVDDTNEPASSFVASVDIEPDSEVKALFCPIGGCIYSTHYSDFDPIVAKESLYGHMRKCHGKSKFKHGGLRAWAFSTEPRPAIAVGNRQFMPLDGRTVFDAPLIPLAAGRSAINELNDPNYGNTGTGRVVEKPNPIHNVPKHMFWFRYFAIVI